MTTSPGSKSSSSGAADIHSAVEIVEVKTCEELADLRTAYLESLAAPMDGMWETFAARGRQLEMRWHDAQAGYASVNEAGQLLQFYVAAPFEPRAAELFAAVVAWDDVAGAMVSTADHGFLSLCLDRQKTVRVHTYLYLDHERIPVETSNGGEVTLDIVERAELASIVALQRDSLDHDPGDWLVGYLQNLIERRELYALRRGGEILGTGEARVSDSQRPFVDLGVITMRGHRGRGVASYILTRLKQRCYEREQVPVCSTTVENIGARRAIANAGFVSRHRLLEVAL